MGKLIAACAQIEVKLREKTSEEEVCRMTAKVEEYLAEAKEREVNVVCFPECALTGYFPESESLNQLPEGLLEEKIKEIQETCRRLKIHCVVGLTEPHEPKPYNVAVVISSEGKIIANYRKTHLYPSEEKYYATGDHFYIFEINGVRCSVIICIDVDRYPEVMRILKSRGAKIVFHPAYTTSSEDYIAEWTTPVLEALYVARAAENGVFLVTVNGGGVQPPESPERQRAHSMIIDPDGDILAKAPRGREELVIAEIDTGLIETNKSGWKGEGWDGRYTRRTDLYKIVDINKGHEF